ncbi:MAG TPA: nucleotidyl transferase AbiEii/AbiGii toxin family protein [Verrucomicrobiota bacterium]|nr:nucleotidyl transferase AbiEii/AbiGii toxin family protein [Verrucomicrobiota bacterium]HNU53080.1 nucleotidyl transferase AbiEii/AbiGii toxin family protein [Verrucomicrobiota bacterium]
MTSTLPITRRDILAHQVAVPWPSQRQVEQDLILCRAMVALFTDEFLRHQIAMRGGTLLHKVHLAPAARYSEDVDLVVVGNRPEDHIRKALRRVLNPMLGAPATSVWDALSLAIRNTVRPSRVLRMTYAVPSLIDPGTTLGIVVEANVTERAAHRPMVEIPFGFTFRDAEVRAQLKAYDLAEMLGTKLRALFQRRRGRDLFDLYWALTRAVPPVDPRAVIESFQYYLQQEGSVANRREFIGLLEGHLADRGFCSDTASLLRTGVVYDPQIAGEYVKTNLLSLLPA